MRMEFQEEIIKIIQPIVTIPQLIETANNIMIIKLKNESIHITKSQLTTINITGYSFPYDHITPIKHTQ